MIKAAPVSSLIKGDKYLMNNAEKSAKALGFRMPGEFEPHDGCWMLWPERTDVWRLNAEPAQHAFTQVATAIAQSEPVTMLVSDRQYNRARSMLGDHIRVLETSSDDAWVRDVGPSFLIDNKGNLAAVDWIFNAWGGENGGLYASWDKDSRVAQKVCQIVGAKCFEAPLVLEGGAIHVDGEGTLITTKQCLLNNNRNPDLAQQDIEQFLEDFLNISKVIWIDQGTVEDETDGHVDNICCFIKPGVVALHWCDDPNDAQYEISHAALKVLEQEKDAKGRHLKIIKLPQPGPLYISAEEAQGIDQADDSHPRIEGQRMAGSYVNFFIANTHIVYPCLDARFDKEIAIILSEQFPDKEIIGISAREILLGGGNIHCITQQQPKPVTDATSSDSSNIRQGEATT